ncbi:hypothetical protein [Butyrivibrio sp. AE2032]|uniref:hypothetical protein n=1 Tax=Butyrivibrio sp. AE2032 TaxID=1458463 RepID=UPI00163A8B31|nr:hypothetical protein [Butyrivibrio sp. AE2032]
MADGEQTGVLEGSQKNRPRDSPTYFLQNGPDMVIYIRHVRAIFTTIIVLKEIYTMKLGIVI